MKRKVGFLDFQKYNAKNLLSITSYIITQLREELEIKIEKKNIIDICVGLLIAFGVACLFLAIWLPVYYEYLRTNTRVFTPGVTSIQDALSILLTLFSILTPVSVAFIVLLFASNDRISKSSLSTLILVVITLLLLGSGLVLSLYFSLERDLTAVLPSVYNVYSDIVMLLLSLAFMFFMIASYVLSLKK